MSLDHYFDELRQQLRRLTEDERREALAFYEEYAAEAALSSADAMIDRFGSPRALAASIYAEAALREVDEKKHRSSRGLLIGLAALMCFPLSASGVLVLGSLSLALVMTLGGLFLALTVSAAALAGAGIFALLHGFALPLQAGTLLVGLGSFLILTPLGCCLFYWLIRLAGRAADHTTRFISRYIKRRSCHEA